MKIYLRHTQAGQIIELATDEGPASTTPPPVLDVKSDGCSGVQRRRHAPGTGAHLMLNRRLSDRVSDARPSVMRVTASVLLA